MEEKISRKEQSSCTCGALYASGNGPCEAAGPGSGAVAMGEDGWVTADPTAREDWDQWLATHPQRSVFHGRAWAQVLQEAYHHRPCYIGRPVGGRLGSLLALMEVDSPLTGRRGVALPFTDFCPVLAGGAEDYRQACERAVSLGRKRGWRHLELRGWDDRWTGSRPSLGFYGHTVALERDEQIQARTCKDAVRRGIRKAAEAGLRIEIKADAEAVRTYYGLHCLTRRKHGLPPQPRAFFESLGRHALIPGQGVVVLAWHESTAVAGALFLHSGPEALFKYGASDPRFQHLRPNNLVMWSAIRHYAKAGFERLHLGRTSLANEGLRNFKLGFGAIEEILQYCKFDFRRNAFVTDTDRAQTWMNHLFRRLPLSWLRLAGRLLYPHVS